MRILSLLPSATEIVYALGLDEQLVGVTVECDYPPEARSKPSVSAPVVPAGSQAEIDQAVRDRVAAGLPLYDLDVDLVRQLHPDLVLSQDLCRVCAVPSGDVTEALGVLGVSCSVLSLDPLDLSGVVDSIRDVAGAADASEAGEDLAGRLWGRLGDVSSIVEGRARRRVACLEWAEPAFAGGHWVPDMVSRAGGTPLLVAAGEDSRQVSWSEIAEAEPEVVVFMPCGYGLEEACSAGDEVVDRLSAGGSSAEVWAVDATSYFSRPGPRLVDGVELLAGILHPDAAAPAAERARRLA